MFYNPRRAESEEEILLVRERSRGGLIEVTRETQVKRDYLA